MKNQPEMNTSWLNGKYKNGEINTSLPIISVIEPPFFAQESDADVCINEIYEIWIGARRDMTSEQAFDLWVQNYL